MRTFVVEKNGHTTPKGNCLRFPIIGGEACPRVFCTMDLVLLAMIMSGRDMREETSHSQSVIKEGSSVARFAEAEK